MSKNILNRIKLDTYIKNTFTCRTMCGRIMLISIISIIASFLLSTIIYSVFINNILIEKIGQELLENLNNKVAIIDNYLNNICDNTSKFSLNEELYEIFRNMPEYPNQSFFFNTDKIITRSLLQHFTNQTDVYAAYLITNNFIYGHMQVFQTVPMIQKSDIYKKVSMSNGECVWIPTFQYKDMFLESSNFISTAEDLKLFVLGKKVRFVSIHNIKTEPEEYELPILLLYFKDNFFDKFFTPIDDSFSCTWIIDGQITIYSSSGDVIPLSSAELSNISDKSGMFPTKDKKMLVVYSKSKVTGWNLITVKSITEMVEETYEVIKFTVILTILLAILFSAIVLAIVKRMLSPLKVISNAIVQSGEGNFTLLLEQKGPEEIMSLVNSYNNMNVKINNLLDEIYRTRLSETKTKLLSLQLEMEPHFLFNTLNAINWLAVDREEEDISEMLTTLAGMLRYILSQENEVAKLQKELEWLNSYIRLIKLRFGDDIKFIFDIDENLLDTTVPVMMLQPFIENAIVHGINGYVKNGIVRITGKWHNGVRVFTVQDNGKGMSADEIANIWNKTPMKIGVRNVDMRIKLIYGEIYGVTIESKPGCTKVTISIA
ncbi:MAG TPA: histidine kinase [Clostridiales bacterium]|nr:histidine kinase [Clostridiales bacterium]